MTKFNLSEERKKFKEDLDYALGKFNWGQSALDAQAIRILNEWKIVLDNQDKEFLRLLKEKNKLKFPLGCDTRLRDENTTCRDISFDNKIILCDNCTQKLINKFEENENEIDKLAGPKLSEAGS